jgi:hypothetical protein
MCGAQQKYILGRIVSDAYFSYDFLDGAHDEKV